MVRRDPQPNENWMKIPRLVAHRGYAKHYPENTLVALQEALKAGACFVEFDVQMTADHVPILLHDSTLLRTGGARKDVLEMTFAQTQEIGVGETKRLGKDYSEVKIPTLLDAMFLLRNFPNSKAFIEIKAESLQHFGIEIVIKTITSLLKKHLSNYAIISFDMLAVRCARAMGAPAIGWVVPSWDDKSRAIATELAPDYLFCNHNKIPTTEALWRGPWQWALYEVTDPQVALALAERGADLIETMAIGEMLQDPTLQQEGCFADKVL